LVEGFVVEEQRDFEGQQKVVGLVLQVVELGLDVAEVLVQWVEVVEALVRQVEVVEALV
jgi:hypothetical protein